MIFQSIIVAWTLQAASAFTLHLPNTRLSAFHPTSSRVVLNGKSQTEKKFLKKTEQSKANGLSSEVTPVEVIPVEVIPVEITPVEVTPVEVTSVEVTPVEVTSELTESEDAAESEEEEETDEMVLFDKANMRKAIEMAQSA
jgi:hypothetical protein